MPASHYGSFRDTEKDQRIRDLEREVAEWRERQSDMAGTIRDQQAELTCLRAKLARPDLIPMPGLKLGIFIGGFVTVLVMAAVLWAAHNV